MYDYMLDEMALAVSRKCHADLHQVMAALCEYWQDKIAHVWEVADLLECAARAGKPITRADAGCLLDQIFDHLDSELGITWLTLEVALEDYQLDFKALPQGDYNQVSGLFRAWRQGCPDTQDFGTFPEQIEGNLPEALALAVKWACEVPGTTIFVGCLRQDDQAPPPWMTVLLKPGESAPLIAEAENHVRLV
jgi:hypothetical protein